MPYDTTKQGVLIKGLSKKAVIAKFDQDHASSDGGAVLLKACDEKFKLSTTLAVLSNCRMTASNPRSRIRCRSCFSSASSLSPAAMPTVTTLPDWPMTR